MSDRQPYKSDLSDERWALIEPVSASWKAQHPSVSGHQGAYEMREIVNALLYQSRTGCQWDYLPHDLPPVGAVKYYFYKWRDDGTDQTIHDLLRWQVRESRGRKADPSLVVLDTQSRQIMAAFAAADAPLRARAVCEAMDLEIAPSNVTNVRLKLKRLVEIGILMEPEQGLFTQLRP